MTPFEAFQTYQAVRLHFTTDTFDYFKYNGRTNITEESFNIRKDKYAYHKAIREIDNDNMHYYFATNFFKRKKNYIKNMFEDKAKEEFRKWKFWQDNRVENFKKDLDNVNQTFRNKSYQELIVTKDDRDPPPLMEMYFWDDISDSTLIILDRYKKLFDVWDVQCINFVWEMESKRLKKFKPFFWNYHPPVDIIYQNIIKEKLEN